MVVVAKPERPTGETVIRCRASITGDLSNCEIASENPAGVGLGASAMRVATRFKVDPPRLNGHPVEGAVLLPFRFQMAGAGEPPPVKPADPPR